MRKKKHADIAVREIRQKTLRKCSAKDKVRIVLEGLQGEESIADAMEEMLFTGGELNGRLLWGKKGT